MPIRRLVVTAIVAWGSLACSTARAQEDRPSRWRFSFGGGATVSAGDVPHLPPLPGLGLRLMVERSWLGVLAGADVMGAYCVNGEEQNEGCGAFSLWGLGPQVVVLPRRSWTPYATLLFQAAHGERRAFGLAARYASEATWVPGIGPRAGVRYRRSALGFYLETGPTFLRPSSDRDCEFGCSAWWFWQTSLGVTFTPG